EHLEAQTEALAHLLAPLAHQRARGRDDQDAARATASDQLGHHEAGLDRLSETDAVREHQADAAHPQSAHHGDQLIGRDGEATRLRRRESARPERLFEQERLVVERPVRETGRLFRIELLRDRLDSLERDEDVHLLTAERAFEATKTKALLCTGGLRVDEIPAEPARFDFGAGEEIGGQVVELAARVPKQSLLSGMAASCAPRR